MSPQVYILWCSNKRYYIGSTIDLGRRLKQHNSGLVKTTRNIRPVKLVFRQSFENITRARRVERRLKSYKNKKIIEKIVKDGIIRKV